MFSCPSCSSSISLSSFLYSVLQTCQVSSDCPLKATATCGQQPPELLCLFFYPCSLVPLAALISPYQAFRILCCRPARFAPNVVGPAGPSSSASRQLDPMYPVWSTAFCETLSCVRALSPHFLWQYLGTSATVQRSCLHVAELQTCCWRLHSNVLIPVGPSVAKGLAAFCNFVVLNRRL